MLSEKSIQKFQELYKKQFGIGLSEKESQEKAIQLLELFKKVYKPITIRKIRLKLYDNK